MLHITCSGSPHEVGLKHGTEASVPISRTIAFYDQLFQETAKLQWEQVRQLALEFEPIIKAKWPRYLEEMQGIATGASVPLSDIIAVNVRTEITFGLYSVDGGCTALSWHQASTPSTTILAQNWDWQTAQAPNLIHLTIHPAPDPSTTPTPLPSLTIITEAGLIGKIGFNSAGVGVCLNAIRAAGVDREKMPCHLALRRVLEARTREEAEELVLREGGVASSCHFLVADAESGGVGLEWSSKGLKRVVQDGEGRVVHGNHYLYTPDEGVVDSRWLPDSLGRTERMATLCRELGKEGCVPTVREVQRLFEDEEGFPASICREEMLPASGSATLFNIVMDLKAKTAEVVVGRPVAPVEKLQMKV